MNYKISVITPSLNSVKYIERAIQSVLSQNYENFEHIIVDAVSTDGTIDILKKYNHLKWISEKDKGQSDAMNKGFNMSTGDVIVYLNIDDYFLPDAFKTIIPYFENGSKFVVGKVKVVMADGQYWINDPKVKHMDILRHWEPNAFPGNPVGYFYLREVQERVGGFNNDNDFAMDLEFLLAASQKYDFTKIDNVLGVYNHLEDTKTAKTQKKLNYWTVKNLSFVNKFLKDMSDDLVKEYINERRKGYRLRTIEMVQSNLNSAKESRNIIKIKWWEWINLYNKHMLQYGNK